MSGHPGRRNPHHWYLGQKAPAVSQRTSFYGLHSIVYTDLVLSGKLYSYLADIDTQARNKLDLLITQLAEKGGINEQLKARDQLAWVRAMNNIRNRAEEIVLKELIYGEDAV